MRKIYIIIFLIVGCVGSYSQTLCGRVMNSDGQALSYVTVSAKEANDSLLHAITLTDSVGAFCVQAAEELYFSCLGYKSQTIKAVDNITVIMEEDAYQLSDVVIASSRIRHQADGYEANLLGNPWSKGRTAIEILALLPGMANLNGSLLILGQSVEKVYVNKLLIHNMDELKQIPAEEIENVKVTYMAGSSESAHAGGGILWVRLKKHQNGGYSGYFQGAQGYMPSYGLMASGLSQMIRYGCGKIQISNIVSFRNAEAIEDMEYNQKVKATGEETSSYTESRSWAKHFQDRLTLNYEIAKKHDLALSGLFYYRDATPKNSVQTDALKTLYSYPQYNKRFQLSSRYDWKTSEKSDFSLAIDYLDVYTKVGEELSNREISRTYQDTRQFRVKPDYSSTLAKDHRLTIGADLYYVWYDETLKEVPKDEVLSKMTTKEPAIYTEFSGKTGLLRYNIGIRFQDDQMDVNYGDVKNENHMIGLYPTASLLYLIDSEKRKRINLQFKRQVSSVPYAALSSYKHYYTPTTYTTGNPQLQIPTSYTLSATYTTGDLLLNAFYSKTSNPIYFGTHTEMGNTIYTKSENGNYSSVLSMYVQYDVKPFKWWRLSPIVKYSNRFYDIGIDRDKWLSEYMLYASSDFMFSKTFGGNLILSYESDSRYYNRSFKAVGYVRGGLYKYLLKNKLALRMECILLSNGRKIITDDVDLIYITKNVTDKQWVSLSVTWRFSGGKKIKAKRGTDSLLNYSEINDQR